MGKTLSPQVRGILFALLTFLCFGMTNFLLGYISEKASDPRKANLIAPILVWLGMGLLAVIFLSILRISGRRPGGFTSRGDTLLAVLAGMVLAFSMISLKIGFMMDPSAKGPITAIASSSAVIVALMARLLLKESLSSLQWAGILITLGGIATMALSSGGSEHALLGIFFGAITLLGFGFTNTILKVIGTHGMNSITAALVIWLTAGICGLAGLGLLQSLHFSITDLNPAPLRIISIAAGFFLGVGMWSLKRGVTVGRAGPVVAVAGANALLVVFLDYLFFGNLVNVLKLAGMATAIGGIVILALFANRIRE